MEAQARGNDSVIIASSLPSHYELTVAALDRKLPVFVEKPMVKSVADAEEVARRWERAGQPLFLCDFTHLWSRGFEFAWARYRSTSGSIRGADGNLKPTPHFHASFGGPGPKRVDCHPVWDYGAHAIAIALLLGIDLKGLKLSENVPNWWVLQNAHAEISICPDLTEKRAVVELEDIVLYKDGIWYFDREPDGHYANTIENQKDMPLQRVLNRFLNGGTQLSGLVREGVGLPTQVTRVLESVCSSASPYK